MLAVYELNVCAFVGRLFRNFCGEIVVEFPEGVHPETGTDRAWDLFMQRYFFPGFAACGVGCPTAF